MNFMLIILMLYYIKYVESYTVNSQDETNQILKYKTINKVIHYLKLLQREKDLNDKNYMYIVKVNNNKKLNDIKPILRLNYDIQIKNKKSKEHIVLQQHRARMKEVNDFMKDHMVTTKYLYDEVKRIQRDRKVKDDLREMVEYLERPENEIEKESLLNFFKKSKKIYSKKKINVWDQKTNDLVINVLKDPFNDGTIN